MDRVNINFRWWLNNVNYFINLFEFSISHYSYTYICGLELKSLPECSCVDTKATVSNSVMVPEIYKLEYRI